ncbi:Gfo/Idh/MocA family oxidoreductase [Oceanospirillaceae bacterium]|nr:Gfo/Idh/MocA family oxidoreductase [bacterium]MDB4214344.1 Gfo/Idh/MocA family oxidoreductase [Oceanospirillaceae bacterium]
MKVLFIGLGSIGQRHLRNLISLSEEPLEIMAYRVSRTVPMLSAQMKPVGSGKALSEKFNITEYSNLDEALECEPDITFITNPSSLHIDCAIKAARSGSHLFIEKPLSNSSCRLDELVKEVENNNLVVTVAYQFRYHPAILKAKEWLENKSIGNIISARFTNGEYMPGWHPYENYRKTYAARNDLGGGAILTQIHEFDIALFLLGKPVSVYCVGGKLSDLEIDVEDSVSVLMSYKSSNRHFPVSIDLDYLQYPSKRGFQIVGDTGSIEWNNIKNTVVLQSRENAIDTVISFDGFDRNSLFIDELQDFISNIKGVNSNMVTLDDGIESLKIALLAKQSMLTRQVINAA